MSENQIIMSALYCAQSLLGMGYSRKRRYRFYKDGSADCSSFVYACFLYAGLALKNGIKHNRVSCAQVYSQDFDLLFPDNYDEIGKTFAIEGFFKEFGWRPGDIVFYCNDKSTKRRNKITHVALCKDDRHIIHCGNNDEKTCIKDISYGDGNIVAVIRLKDGVLPNIGPKNFGRAGIMRKQLIMNMHNEKINCTGIPTLRFLVKCITKKKRL